MIRPTDWMTLALDSWRLGAEASTVIAMRMAKLAVGDAAAMAEARLMIAEKVEATSSLQWMALTGGLGHTDADRARAMIAHYRKAVAGNRKRLGRKKAVRKRVRTGR